MAEDLRKTELIHELARARSRLAANVSGLRRDVNVAPRLQHGFERFRAPLLGGAGLFGLLLARLPARRKKVVIQPKSGRKAQTENKVLGTGLFLAILKMLFGVVRPALTKLVLQRVGEHAGRGFGGSSPR